MLLTYIKLALRLISRNPFFTLINLAGLSIGFAVFFVLWQYAQSELSSDRQWKDWQRIARLGLVWESTDNGRNWKSSTLGTTRSSIAPKLVDEYDELETYTRIMHQGEFSAGYTTLVGNRIVAAIDNDGSKYYFNEY